MARTLRPVLVLGLFLGWCGCFRGLDAVPGEAATQPSISLQVRDQLGAAWQADQAPRWPIFVLQFADRAPADAERYVFLLRGPADAALLSDLSSAQLRAATEARRLPLLAAPAGALLEAQPTQALEAGTLYTLVWAHAGATLSFPLGVSRSPAAGARLSHSLPGALERQVAPNLSRVLLRFDGYVRGDVPRHVQLLDAADDELPAQVRSASCAELGLGAGDCVSIKPLHELAPGARHRVMLAAGLEDATGAPIAAHELAFETADAPDLHAPVWLGVDCARDELAEGPLCVLVSDTRVAIRARADENGLLALAIAGELSASLGSSGDYALEAPLDGPQPALLQLSDLAGNAAQLELELAPVAGLAQLSIDEVRVDPLGPEPSQEYVELLNFGASSMSVADFSLSDDPFAAGARIAAATLAAGERALVVAADFDPADARDEAPAAGVKLLRLAGALPLRNEGSALVLRDARGQRVSAAPAIAPEQAGQCIARVGADRRSGKSADFALDPRGGCTPGYASDAARPALP